MEVSVLWQNARKAIHNEELRSDRVNIRSGVTVTFLYPATLYQDMSAERFWSDADDRHKEIAKQFYEGIETYSPSGVTGLKGCWMNRVSFGGHCNWCETRVTYQEYRGERL